MLNSLSRSKAPIATALVGAIVIACSAPPSLASDESAAPRVMTITGHGTASGVPDIGTINMGVETRAESATKALADNSAQMTRLIDTLKKAGVYKKDIQTSQFNVSPRCARSISSSAYDCTKIVGYEVTNQVHVIVRDLDDFGTILDGAVSDGANKVHGISFDFSNPQPVMDEARVAAVADAKRKAELYANAAGVTLGGILTFTESYGGTPRPVHAKAMMEASSVPIAVGESGLSASVSITFELK